MAVQNPFTIEPTASLAFSRGLGQLGSAYMQKQQQQEQRAALAQEAQDVLESGDPLLMSQFMVANPQIAQGFESALQFKDQATKQNAVESAQRILQGEDPQVVLRDRAAFVSRAGGDPTQTLEALDDTPEQIKQSALMVLTANKTPQEIKAMQSVGLLPTAEGIAKDTRTSKQKEYSQYQQLKKSDPDAAKEFGRAAGFIDEVGQELSVHLQKRLSDSTDMAIESRSNVAEFENLADQIEGANIGGGIFQGSWAERVKDITGQQDAVTSLRKRYNAIKGSQVVKNLPPGAASDADIALALAGFPTDNASGPQLASFLRGVAKLEERQANFQDFKANYISENRTERGMLKAYKEQQEEAEAPEAEQETVLNGDNIVMTHPQYGEITEADIEQTMRANNLTREQVLQRLGGQ